MIILNITKDWVINYIKNYGTDIVIPKEAEVIKTLAFNSFYLENDFEEGFFDRTTFTLRFEEGSKLKRIEFGSIMGIRITNEILIPDSVEKIDGHAFGDRLYEVRFGKNTQVSEMDCTGCMLFTEEFVIPPKIEELKIDEYNVIKKIIVPLNSKIKKLAFSNNIEQIVLPSGIILKSDKTNMVFLVARCDGSNAWKIISRRNKKMYFEIIDANANDLRILQTGELLDIGNPDGYIYENGVYLYDTIFQVNPEYLLDGERVFLGTDYLKIEGYEYVNQAGRKNGYMYNKEEIIAIKEIILEIVNKVVIPPKELKNREKIIYAQIVNNLFEYIKYDYDALNLMNNKDKIDFYDTKSYERIAASQNMKGLLVGATVCKGFSTIINTLTLYFGIQSKSIIAVDQEHAWNYLNLDNTWYEDDFTWYRDELAVSDIMGIDTFLAGKEPDGTRKFDKLKHHKIEENIELGDSITLVQQLNLLATDWSKVTDWAKVDLNSSEISESLFKDLVAFASNNRQLLAFLLKNKEKNNQINSLLLGKKGK